MHIIASLAITIRNAPDSVGVVYAIAQVNPVCLSVRAPSKRLVTQFGSLGKQADYLFTLIFLSKD